jgi:hypothetical protein
VFYLKIFVQFRVIEIAKNIVFAAAPSPKIGNESVPPVMATPMM